MSVEEKMNLIEPNPPQYYLFKEYARAVKSFLEQVLYLKRFSRDDQPNIFYSTPRKAWAKHIQPIVNGFSETPICTFYLNNMAPKQGETMGGWVFVKEDHPDTPDDDYRYSWAPSIWRLDFKTTLWAKTMADMDTMLSQILIYTQSPKLWSCMVDGAWCEIGTESVAIEDEMEPGDAKDKVVRRSLNTYVRRAYLPRESFDYPKIKEINVTLEDNLENEITTITVDEEDV